jgi:hypothetical protein
MNSLRTPHVIVLCFACCLTLEATAVALLLLARQRPRLKTIGGYLLNFGPKVFLALPGIIFAGVLVENMSPTSLQPYLYALGASSSFVLLELCLHLE